MIIQEPFEGPVWDYYIARYRFGNSVKIGMYLLNREKCTNAFSEINTYKTSFKLIANR